MAIKKDKKYQYIYVDHDSGDNTWRASDIYETKKDAYQDYLDQYNSDRTNNGFFLEVDLPDIEVAISTALNAIPTYRV